MTRSAPAVLNRSATRRALIGSRPRPFLSCREYGKYGATTVMRFADARLAASSMMRVSIIHSLTGGPKLWMRNRSHPRIETSKRVRISPDAKVRYSVGTSSVLSCAATSAASSGCELPRATTRRFFVLATRPGAMSFARSSSTVFFLRAIVRLLCAAGPGCDIRRTGARPVLLDPPLDVALRGDAESQSAGRHILADDRPGPGLRAVSDPNGRHEDVVRPGVHLVADLGAVLGQIVVVRGDRTGAQVDPAADGRIADVRQVGHLASLADRGVLGLDEGADLALVAEVRARAQVRERPDVGTRADDRERRIGARDDGVLADLARHETRVRADQRTRADRGRPQQVRVGQHRHVGG